MREKAETGARERNGPCSVRFSGLKGCSVAIDRCLSAMMSDMLIQERELWSGKRKGRMGGLGSVEGEGSD